MAIAFTEMTAGESNVDAGTYTTASITLTVGRLYLLAVYNTHASGSTPTAVATTGAALSFTSAAGTGAYGTSHNTSIWRCLATSTVTDTIVITRATATGAFWTVVEVTGMDPSGVNGAGAVVQTKAATNSSTSLTTTLDASIIAGNARFTCGASAVNSTNLVASSGTWTGGTAQAHAVPNASARVAWNAAPATTDTASIWTPNASGINGACIIELKLNPGGSPVGFIPI